MTFNNANYSVKNKLKRLGTLIVVGACIAAFTTIDDLDLMLGFSRHFLSIVVLFIYICYTIFRYAKEYNFISFSTELGKLTIKFYQLITFRKKAKSFDFPLAEFQKYEIQKKGLKTLLIIYRRQDRQIVKYPPICINSLKTKELEQITKTLDTIKLY